MTIFRGLALPTLLIIVLAFWTVRRMGAARTAAQETAALAATPDDGVIIPVRGLYWRGGGLFGGSAHNSIRPSLAVAPDGVRYRVLRRGTLPYAEIEHVDVRKGLFGFSLIFVSGRQVLAADVGDPATAKRALDALPRSTKLTAEAAILRDGNPSAATPGLRPYRGRVR